VVEMISIKGLQGTATVYLYSIEQLNTGKNTNFYKFFKKLHLL